MPLPKHAQSYSRHANPYNSWVARERQQKYYERKKTLARFKRMEKYESKQQQQQGQQAERSDGKHSFLERAIQGGQEAFDAEYERRLALSFGDVPAPVATLKTEKAKCKKKRKQQHTTTSATAREDATHTVDNVTNHTANGSENDADMFQPSSSAKKMRKGSAATPPADEAVSSSGERATKADESTAGEVTQNKNSKKQWQRTKNAVPNRFAKELKKHQEAEDAKQAEWLRRQEEIAEKKRKRRSFQRERAVKGELLAKRTARGQPNMKNMLQVLTAKLKPELRNA